MKIISFLFLLTTVIYSERILIIGSYHDEYPWQQEYKKALISQLDNNHQIYSFNLDSKRLELEEVKSKVLEAIDYVDKINPDIVVLGDDNALNYLSTELTKRNINIVFLGINENLREYFIRKPDNITGVLSRPYYKRAILTIGELIDPVKKVLILFDSSPTSKGIISENFEGVDKIHRIKIHVEVVSYFNNWKRAVEVSEDNFDAIIIGSYQKIKKNNVYLDGEELIKWTSKNSPVPIFSFWAFGVGSDMSIGGLVVSGEKQGVEAAKIINQILNEGKKPSEIYPVSVLGGKYLFSREQLKKWQLTLPEDILKEAEFTD